MRRYPAGGATRRALHPRPEIWGTSLPLAVDGEDLFGFQHRTFFASGPVACVKELLIRGKRRRGGVGRALMNAFERWDGLAH
jgi:GNAT superfamily N-acetyltransferase